MSSCYNLCPSKIMPSIYSILYAWFFCLDCLGSDHAQCPSNLDTTPKLAKLKFQLCVPRSKHQLRFVVHPIIHQCLNAFVFDANFGLQPLWQVVASKICSVCPYLGKCSHLTNEFVNETESERVFLCLRTSKAPRKEITGRTSSLSVFNWVNTTT